MNFSPGPSQLYPTTSKHIEEALKTGVCSISHRSDEFRQLFSDCCAGVKKLLHVPENWSMYFLGSGTEAMERLLQGCSEHRSFHFVNGAFSEKFYLVATELGRDAKALTVPKGQAYPLNDIKEIDGMEFLAVTQSETSTGFYLPPEDLHQIRKQAPDAIMALDMVSSAPYCTLENLPVDAAFFSIQKGFGLPAGMGVLLASPRVVEKAEELQRRGLSVGTYHSIPLLEKLAKRNETPETPNVLGIFLLNRVCQDLLQLEDLQTVTEEKANLLYRMLEDHPDLQPFVEDPRHRSPTCVVGKQREGVRLRERLLEKGITIAGGYSRDRDACFRIANFPSHSLQQVQNLIQAIATL